MSSITFDYFLEERIGFGKYQITAFIVLALVDFTDGVELITMSVIMSILQNEWKISDLTIEITTSMFYLGMFIGAMLSGKCSDTYGRRKTIIFACFFQFLTSLFFYYINSSFSLITLRLFYGICYGFSLPITITSISEITTKELRGKVIIIMNFFVTIGKLYGLVLIYFCLNDFDSGNWRRMMFISALTSLVVALGNYFYLKESPRFLIAIGHTNEGVEILDYIGYENKGENYESINETEVNGLISYQNRAFTQEDRSNYKALFTEKTIAVTIRLWIVWFSLVFIEFGQYAILPFILKSGKKGFGAYILAIIGETPAILLSLYLIEKENFGRKNTLTYNLIALTLLNLMIFFCQTEYIGLFLALGRFAIKNSYSMVVPLTAEVYPTLYRTIGYGWASGCGRLAAVIAPFILFKLYRYDTYSPFMAFFIVGIAATLASHTLPYDTMGHNLDESFLDDEYIQQSRNDKKNSQSLEIDN